MVRGADDGLTKSVNFYKDALGLSVMRQTEEWAELCCGTTTTDNSDTNNTSSSSSNAYFRMTIKSVHNESQLCKGYSPFLNFDVIDMDTTIAKCAQMGGHLDGPIQYPAHGKTAVLRTPDGHMIGLHEPI